MDVVEGLKGKWPGAQVIETHTSHVFLNGKFAYKLKKPVNYGFLDYSTLEKRRYYCEEELRLNSRFSDIYLDVLPVTIKEEGVTVGGDGEVVDYVVKMQQLPDGSLLSDHIKAGNVQDFVMPAIARIIARLYRDADNTGSISNYGSMETLQQNVTENWEQTLPFIGRTITQEDYDLIKSKTDAFLESHQELFESRVNNGFIREGHGDLHSGNIFVTDEVQVFDCIEFNERFKNQDSIADVAFLMMDLEYLGRNDLSELFIKEYFEVSGDEEGKQLLTYYASYRAFVRGKVASFMIEGMPEKIEEAQKYFKLAKSYAEQL
ncbi:hypothetical protein H6504_00135 [Candidatus Woesearchaeota archaeon]|nr:hypothetical protein [Candidatus Woesearchaeota archaeon]